MSNSFHQVRLPIDMSDGLSMDSQEAKALGQMLHEDYKKADPFEHMVMDGFLPDELIARVRRDFPAEKLASDVVFEIGYAGHHKRQILPLECNASAREFFAFMNSAPVLQFLEGLTGIDALLPDPYFEGGGFHEISYGGKLGVHADFRINEQLHVQRRLNLLIYLNEDWNDEWHGQLELWDKTMSECRAKVSPLWNRCVVFSTDADTWHGHPDELLVPDGVKRRSVALYYYTASKAVYGEVPNLGTIYQARPTDDASVKAEARSLVIDQYLRDYLPGAAYRSVHRVKRVWRRAIGKL
jgi:Rps23 Pro-64 3,4-dihydroxylase Tpa1-like proline 4-hydroxylase